MWMCLLQCAQSWSSRVLWIPERYVRQIVTSGKLPKHEHIFVVEGFFSFGISPVLKHQAGGTHVSSTCVSGGTGGALMKKAHQSSWL